MINLGKEQVTLKEKKALDTFLENRGSNLQYLIEYYIGDSFNWDVEYKPLKLMAFDKFVKCLVNGYEIKFDDELEFNIPVDLGNINVSYNYEIEELFKNIDKEVIYLSVKEKSAGLTIEQTKELIKCFHSLIQQIEDVY
jgi:hypothetical protein